MSGEVIMPGLADFIERWDEQERAARERLAALAAKPMPEGGTIVYEVSQEGTGGDLSDFQAASVSEPHFGYSTPQIGSGHLWGYVDMVTVGCILCGSHDTRSDEERAADRERLDLAATDIIGSWGAWPREDED